MKRSNPSTLVGGGEMKRDTSSLDIAAKSAGASLARSSRSTTSDPVSVGRPDRQSMTVVVSISGIVDTTVSRCA